MHQMSDDEIDAILHELHRTGLKLRLAAVAIGFAAICAGILVGGW